LIHRYEENLYIVEEQARRLVEKYGAGNAHHGRPALQFHAPWVGEAGGGLYANKRTALKAANLSVEGEALSVDPATFRGAARLGPVV